MPQNRNKTLARPPLTEDVVQGLQDLVSAANLAIHRLSAMFDPDDLASIHRGIAWIESIEEWKQRAGNQRPTARYHVRLPLHGAADPWREGTIIGRSMSLQRAIRILRDHQDGCSAQGGYSQARIYDATTGSVVEEGDQR